MKDEFQQVVTRYADVLYRLAFSYCGNPPDAEDVVQDVFVKYLRCKKTFESEDKRRAWLMTVTANRCLDLLRSHERRKTQSIETMPETAAPDQEDYSDIHEAIQALSPKYRVLCFCITLRIVPRRRSRSCWACPKLRYARACYGHEIC